MEQSTPETCPCPMYKTAACPCEYCRLDEIREWARTRKADSRKSD